MHVPNYCYYALITRVIDGDSYEVTVDAGFRMYAEMPLRLAHVDTPEMKTLAGKAARAKAVEMIGPLPAKVVVQTVKPIEKYGRYLASIYLPGPDGGELDLAATLILLRQGSGYEGGTKTPEGG